MYSGVELPLNQNLYNFIAGKLNSPLDIPFALFEQECRFFKIPNEFIDSVKRREGIFPELIATKNAESSEKGVRAKCWDILEHPHTSTAAWNFGLFSLAAVVLSIITGSMETMKSLNAYDKTWVSPVNIGDDLEQIAIFVKYGFSASLGCHQRPNPFSGAFK